MSDRPHARKRPSLTLHIDTDAEASPATMRDVLDLNAAADKPSTAAARGDVVPLAQKQEHQGQHAANVGTALRNVLAVQYKAFPKQPAPFVYMLASIEGETLTIITKDAKSSEIALPPKRIVRGAFRDKEYYAIMESLTSCTMPISKLLSDLCCCCCLSKLTHSQA